MAEIFYERETKQPPFIPYIALAKEMFPSEAKQQLMPFLGAGASLPRRSSPSRQPLSFALQDKIDAISAELKLTRRARLFMDIAVRLAAEIKIEEESLGATLASQDVLSRAENSRFPPAADDLSEVLAKLSSYDTFEGPRRKLSTLLAADEADLGQVLRWLAILTDITRPTAPLLSVSSYYEYILKRESLWKTLHNLFVNKNWPTATNFMVARAAHWHLRPERRARKDYLIITTNYDCLMEIALDLFRVPYCVLTVDRIDRHVDVRFSGDSMAGLSSKCMTNSVQNYLGLKDSEYRELQEDHMGKFPNKFTLQVEKPLAVVYKIHGCLFPNRPNGDSIILSDEDYVDYLCRLSDNDGMIPSTVVELMGGKGFMFCGYSFSDWNVRGIYKRLVERRGGANFARSSAIQDYALVRDLNPYESAFFRQKNISLLQTELDRFARRVRREAKSWMKGPNVSMPS